MLLRSGPVYADGILWEGFGGQVSQPFVQWCTSVGSVNPNANTGAGSSDAFGRGNAAANPFDTFADSERVDRFVAAGYDRFVAAGFVADRHGDRPAFGADLYGDRPAFGADLQGNRPAFGADHHGDRPAFGADNYGNRPAFGADSYGDAAAPAFGAPAFGADNYYARGAARGEGRGPFEGLNRFGRGNNNNA